MGEEILGQLEKATIIRDMLSTEGWTTRPAIAKELGVNVKTVGRYIKALKEMGHDIESSRGKGLRLASDYCEGQLLLTEEELYALFLSLAKSAELFPKRVVESLRRRLINQLSVANRRKVQGLRNGERHFENGKHKPNFEVLADIFQALSKSWVMRLSYQGLKDLEPAPRRVGPLNITCAKDIWYLEAWDLDKDGPRNFRLDRISSSTLVRENFQLDKNRAEFEHHPWDFGREQETVVLKLRPQLALWLQENPVHPSQSLEAQSDGIVLGVYQVRSREKFIDWVIGLRGFELVSPSSYRDALRERARTLANDTGTMSVEWEV